VNQSIANIFKNDLGVKQSYEDAAKRVTPGDSCFGLERERVVGSLSHVSAMTV